MTFIGQGAAGNPEKSIGFIAKEGTELGVYNSYFTEAAGPAATIQDEATVGAADGGGVVVSGVLFGTHSGFGIEGDPISWDAAAWGTFVMDQPGNVDGVDLMPYLQGKAKGVPHEALYWRFGEQWAIRKGDWKLVASRIDGKEPRLFNLKDDIGEAKDLTEKHPDKKKELLAAWQAWNAEQKDPLWRPVAKKRALATAGAMAAWPGSPTPPQKPPEGDTRTSTGGISARRSRR